MILKPAVRLAGTGLVSLMLTLLLTVACGDDSGADPAPNQTNTTEPTPVSARTIEVRAVDYAFEGLSASIARGTEITLVNNSEVEVHELVAIRVADSETRPVAQLLELSDEELEGVIADMPAMVIVAMPGEAGTVMFGDATFTEPGRYGLLCFIPTGADPAAVMESEGEFPEDLGGPPHAFQGMFAEIRVE